MGLFEMLKWVFGIAAVLIFAPVIYRCYRRWRTDRSLLKMVVLPNNTAYFVKEDLLRIKTENKKEVVMGSVMRYANRNLTPRDRVMITRYYRETEQGCVREDTKEAIRMINVKCAVYEIPLPMKALYADERSRVLMEYLMIRLELVTPVSDLNSDVYFGQEAKDDFKKWTANSVDNYAQQVLNLKYANGYWLFCGEPFFNKFSSFHQMDEAIGRSMLTAYAIFHEIKIPRDYIRYDNATKHYLELLSTAHQRKEPEPKEEVSHLKLVK